jgi:hypothetical protein
MKSRHLLAVVSVALFLTGLTASQPASADTPGCVTRAEFRNVSEGMSKHRVHRIFDTRGEGSGYSRYYEKCRDKCGDLECRPALVTYDGRGRLSDKLWD